MFEKLKDALALMILMACVIGLIAVLIHAVIASPYTLEVLMVTFIGMLIMWAFFRAFSL